MLSIAVVGASQAVNYYKKDNYYSEKETVENSQWYGKGAELLGLSGQVNFKNFEHLINGRDSNGKNLSNYSVSEEESRNKEKMNKLTDEQVNEIKKNISSFLEMGNFKEHELHSTNSALLSAFKYKAKLSKTQSNILKSRISKSLASSAINKKERDSIKSNIFKEIDNVTIMKERRAAFDLTFSASKSVSIQGLVFKDQNILDMHHKAVKNALEKCEKEFSTIRVKVDGVTERRNTGNFTVATFQHDTSRLLDPQLHTHCVIMNLTNDGKEWRALSNEEIMQYSKFLGMTYQNELGRLLQENGYKIKTKSNGTFELASYKREQIEIFSKRSEQLKEMGALNQKEATKLVLVDRKAKEIHVPEYIKNKFWLETALDSGMKKDIPNENNTYLYHVVKNGIKLKEEVQRAIQLVSERDVKFSKYQIIQAVMDNNLCKFTDEKLEKEVDKELKYLIPVMNGKKYTTQEALDIEKRTRKIVENGFGKFDSFLEGKEIDSLLLIKDRVDNELKSKVIHDIKSLLDNNKIDETSKTLIMKAIEEKNQDSIRISGSASRSLKNEIWYHIKSSNASITRNEKKSLIVDIVNELNKITGLTQGQMDAVKKTLSSKDKVFVWQGNAGSGKTTSVRMITESIKNEYNIYGFSPTTKAAQGLASSVGIKADSVSELLNKNYKFENDSSQKIGLDSNKQKNNLWIVDEAGMLGAKQAEDLFNKAIEHNARVLLIGDTKQLASVEAGNPFKDIQRTANTVCYLNESVRQKDPILDEAVQLLNADDMVQAIHHIKEDHIYVIEDEFKIAEVMAKEFLSLSEIEREQTIVTALTNESLLRINHEIREGLKKEGKLTDSLEIKILKTKNTFQNKLQYANAFEEGDIVSFQKNIREMGVPKNELHRVIHIDTVRNTIQVENIKTKCVASIDLYKKYAMNLFTEAKLEVSVGDRLMWNQNDKDKERVNKHLFHVIETDKDKNKMTIKYPHSGKIESIDLNDYLKANHAWSITYYAAQGATVKNCFIADDKSAAYNNMYVYMTRATNDMKIYTTSIDNMIKRAENKLSKNTATELLENKIIRQNIKETSDKKFRNINYLKDKEVAKSAILNAISSTTNEVYFRGKNEVHKLDKKTLIDKDLFPESRKNLNELFLVAPQDVSSLYSISSQTEKLKILNAHKQAVGVSLQYLEQFVYGNKFDSYQVNRTYAFDREGMTPIPLVSSSIYIANSKENSSYLLNEQMGVIKNIYENELASQLKREKFELRIYDNEIRVNKVDRQLSQEFLKSYNRQLKGLDLKYFATLGEAESRYSDKKSLDKNAIETKLSEFISSIGPLKEKLSFQDLKDINQIKKEVSKEFINKNEIFNETELLEKVFQKGKGHLDFKDCLSCYLSIHTSEEFKTIGYSKNGKSFLTNKKTYKNESEIYQSIRKRSNENNHYISNKKIKEFILINKLNTIVANNLENILSKKGGIKVCSDLLAEDKNYVIEKSMQFFMNEGFQPIQFNADDSSTKKDTISIKKLFFEFEAGEFIFSKNQVLLVDNSHLLGSHEMRRLILEAESAGSKIVLFGDTKDHGFTQGKPYAVIDGMIGINPYYRKEIVEANKDVLVKPEKENLFHSKVLNENQIKENERLKSIMDKVAEYYHDNLFKNNLTSKEAMEYLDKSRDMNLNNIKSSLIGVSSYSGMIELAKKNGFSIQEMEKCGLVTKNQKGEYYDTFRNRIMFPIKNEKGNVIAFGGRIFRQKEILKNAAKYVNSKETQIFSKSKELFGLDNAIEAIKREGKVYICEGYMDAIALKKAGIHNSVAVLGTSLTKDHIESLKKYTDNIILMFDKDKAGKEASIRSYFQTYNCNINLSMTQLDGKAKDVDEYLKLNSSSDLQYVLNKNQVNGDRAVGSLLMEKHGGNALAALSEFQEKYYPIMSYSKDKLKKELDLMMISLEFGVGEIISNEKDRKFLSQFMKQNFDVPLDVEKLKEELAANKNGLLETVAKLNLDTLSNENMIRTNEERGKEISSNYNFEILKDIIYQKCLADDPKLNRDDSSKIVDDLSKNLSDKFEKKVNSNEVIKYYNDHLSNLNTLEMKNHIDGMATLYKNESKEIQEKNNKYLLEFDSKFLLKYKGNEILNTYYHGERWNECLNICFDNYKVETYLNLSKQNGYNPSDKEVSQQINSDYQDGTLFKFLESSISKDVNEIIEMEKGKNMDKVLDMFEVKLNYFANKGEDLSQHYNEIKVSMDYRSIVYKEIENAFQSNNMRDKIDSYSMLEKYHDQLINQTLGANSEDFNNILKKSSEKLLENEINNNKSLSKSNTIKESIKNEFLELKKSYSDFESKLNNKIASYKGEYKGDLLNDVKQGVIEESKVLYKRKYGNDTDQVTALLNFVSDKLDQVDNVIDKTFVNIIDLSLSNSKIEPKDDLQVDISKTFELNLLPSDLREFSDSLGITKPQSPSLSNKI